MNYSSTLVEETPFSDIKCHYKVKISLSVSELVLSLSSLYSPYIAWAGKQK